MGVTWTRLATSAGDGVDRAGLSGKVRGVRDARSFAGRWRCRPTTGDTFALTWMRTMWTRGFGRMCARRVVAGVRGMRLRLRSGWGRRRLEVGRGSAVISQGDYDLALAAVEVRRACGHGAVMWGRWMLYRCSLAAGCVLRNTTNALNGCAAPARVAPAQHAIAALAGAGTGGRRWCIWGMMAGFGGRLDGVNQQQTPCSADDATHFDNLNGGIGSLAEVVSFAQDPTDAETLLAGLGANGTAATGTAAERRGVGAACGGRGWVRWRSMRRIRCNWYVSIAAGVNVRLLREWGGVCGGGLCGGADDWGGAGGRGCFAD